MCPIVILFVVWEWLLAHEQSLAVWIEGGALVAIFWLELKEYRRQGVDRAEQHRETLKQFEIMESHAIAAKDNAEAARITAQALLNSERAWIEIELGPPEKDYEPDEEDNILDLFECSIQIENHGRTIARIESVQIGADTVNGPLSPEPLNSHTRNLHTVLGSGQKETVGGFDADSGFLDGENIVNGTKRGILRIIVKYRDVMQPSTLRETSAVYVFQNSLEDAPERVSSLCIYT